MNRLIQMNFLWIFVTCLLTTAVRTRTVAYMDQQTQSANFSGCGDTIQDTISGWVSSFIPPFSSDLNCSLALFSPPGTRLSLIVINVQLSNKNPNTCGDGNRLKILGSNTEGAMSLLPTFPHGLCGFFKPSKPIESTDNRIFLILRSVNSTVESTFSIRFTAFKTEPDETCYNCEVSGLRDTQFCIDQNLVCDGEQNCPAFSYSEEDDPRCSASTASPGSSLSITVIVIIVILMVVLLAIIIFTILALMAKRVRSKRARNSVRRPQRASQSRPGNPAQGGGGGPPRQQHRRPTPDSRRPQATRIPTEAPTFTTEGEYRRPASEYPRDVPPPVIMNPAGAPPPYSTLPRPYEESLQIADGTNPTSRSRLPSIENDLENH